MVHMNQTELKALNSISTSHYGRNDLNYDNLETIKKRVAHGVSTTESTRMQTKQQQGNGRLKAQLPVKTIDFFHTMVGKEVDDNNLLNSKISNIIQSSRNHNTNRD